mmetsp:Transcript_65191/g.170726  ORF Transcript_65191/g.170726 Transcript_65191/m.170726 type:complete len:143 (-) Transcript_65191:63-491(-)
MGMAGGVLPFWARDATGSWKYTCLNLSIDGGQSWMCAEASLPPVTLRLLLIEGDPGPPAAAPPPTARPCGGSGEQNVADRRIGDFGELGPLCDFGELGSSAVDHVWSPARRVPVCMRLRGRVSAGEPRPDVHQECGGELGGV